ncbi:hypothetical protein CVT24_001908 [Panaeolus cyanescens]|uniref:Uncharacterized protein n=1 Tax=Panaeolus cyanescens TaxID=181874 RepID=A0A409YEN5_9AGAR|nr:hypothetical protein CVT24_001908 [Panaeolus cyanescens]
MTTHLISKLTVPHAVPRVIDSDRCVIRLFSYPYLTYPTSPRLASFLVSPSFDSFLTSPSLPPLLIPSRLPFASPLLSPPSSLPSSTPTLIHRSFDKNLIITTPLHLPAIPHIFFITTNQPTPFSLLSSPPTSSITEPRSSHLLSSRSTQTIPLYHRNPTKPTSDTPPTTPVINSATAFTHRKSEIPPSNRNSDTPPANRNRVIPPTSRNSDTPTIDINRKTVVDMPIPRSRGYVYHLGRSDDAEVEVEGRGGDGESGRGERGERGGPASDTERGEGEGGRGGYVERGRRDGGDGDGGSGGFDGRGRGEVGGQGRKGDEMLGVGGIEGGGRDWRVIGEDEDDEDGDEDESGEVGEGDDDDADDSVVTSSSINDIGIRRRRGGGGGEGYAMIPSSLGHEYHHDQDIDADVNAFEGSGSRGVEFGGVEAVGDRSEEEMYDSSFDSNASLEVGRGGVDVGEGRGEGGAGGGGGVEGYGFEYGYGYRVVRASAGYGYQVVRPAGGGGERGGSNADADVGAEREGVLDETHATISTEIGTSTELGMGMGMGVGDESQGTTVTSYAHVPLIPRSRVERFSRVVDSQNASGFGEGCESESEGGGDEELVDVNGGTDTGIEMKNASARLDPVVHGDCDLGISITQSRLVRSAAIGGMGRGSRRSGFVEGFEVDEDEGGVAQTKGGGVVQGMEAGMVDAGVNVTMVEVENRVPVTRQGVPMNATATAKCAITNSTARSVPMVQRLNAKCVPNAMGLDLDLKGLGVPKLGGGWRAFRVGERRIARGDEDGEDDLGGANVMNTKGMGMGMGKTKRKKSLRGLLASVKKDVKTWNEFKWALVVTNLVVSIFFGFI